MIFATGWPANRSRSLIAIRNSLIWLTRTNFDTNANLCSHRFPEISIFNPDSHRAGYLTSPDRGMEVALRPGTYLGESRDWSHERVGGSVKMRTRPTMMSQTLRILQECKSEVMKVK